METRSTHGPACGDDHSGPRWFEPELSAALLGRPSDWLLVRRLWRAAGHIGFEETIAADDHPAGTLRRQPIERARPEERRGLARGAFTRLDR